MTFQEPTPQSPMSPEQNTFSDQPLYEPPTGQPITTPPVPLTASAAQPATPVVNVNVPKQGRGWIVGLAVVICLFLFSLFCLHSCSSLFSSFSSTSTGEIENNSIAIIDMQGTIQYDGSACSPEGLYELLSEAEENDKIKAVVLRMNSGGGTATAGEEMADYVREFSKPVVVSSASINASAAYEISSQADYIYVAKTTEIGAIGTAMELTDISGLLDMLGVNIETITSSESKDSSYGYRALTDEERAYYQAMIDQINECFIKTVAEGRDMDIEDVRALATGLSFTGIDAVDNGLADEIGTRNDAIEKAAELAGLASYSTCDLGFSDYSISDLEYFL